MVFLGTDLVAQPTVATKALDQHFVEREVMGDIRSRAVQANNSELHTPQQRDAPGLQDTMKGLGMKLLNTFDGWWPSANAWNNRRHLQEIATVAPTSSTATEKKKGRFRKPIGANVSKGLGPALCREEFGA